MYFLPYFLFVEAFFIFHAKNDKCNSFLTVIIWNIFHV